MRWGKIKCGVSCWLVRWQNTSFNFAKRWQFFVFQSVGTVCSVVALKWLITLGFMQVGLDLITSANCKSKLWFGQDRQLSTLVLKFNFIFSISSGCGQMEY